jgi:hypothetical protein
MNKIIKENSDDENDSLEENISFNKRKYIIDDL